MSQPIRLFFVFISLLTFVFCQVSDEEAKFEEFAKALGKKFEDANQKQEAFEVFRKSLAQLRKLERQKQQRGTHRATFNLELNKFAIMTDDEKEQMNGARPMVVTASDPQIKPIKARGFTVLPTSIDWVAKGAVNPVSDQGNCGSCWTFGANGALEAAIFIKTGKLPDLSEQNLVDCDKSNSACNGGWPPRVWSTYTSNTKLMSSSAYPYSQLSINYNGDKNPPQDCKYDNASSLAYNTKGTIYVNNPGLGTAGNETLLQAHVAEAPVSVAIYASAYSFGMYKSGVYSDLTCSSNASLANHAVLVVGYGTDSDTNTPFWKVKNSWGENWGEAGYIRIKRGINLCGIANWGARPAL